MTISDRASAMVQEMPKREQSTAERFRLVAEEWAEVDAAFYLLENTRTSIASELTMAEVSKGMPVSKAEHVAKSSQAYRDHVKKAADAKREANILRARVEYLRMRDRKEDRQERNQMSERAMARRGT